MVNMKIAIGSDHGGFVLKQDIITVLKEQNLAYHDFGPTTAESTDYPDYALAVSKAVASKECDLGILICGTGIGMSITANKVKGIRAALVTDLFTAKVTREHNDSNVLCLGARVTGPQIALEIVRIWLSASFEGGRHQKRVDKITNYESNC